MQKLGRDSVSEWAMQKFDMEIFNLRNLNKSLKTQVIMHTSRGLGKCLREYKTSARESHKLLRVEKA
jgi:hypothetical protein